MCGIAGVWFLNDEVDNSVIHTMTDTLAHRGPDGDGFWRSSNGSLQLGHRRLSIIDISENGKQPMEYLSRYVITFNGEIYNYIEIRSELEQYGYSFRSKTDTEVVLAAYDYWKESCLSHFDGMFSFCIYDKDEKDVFCARDRFGEKPFYYAIDKEKFVFASEMKALWSVGISRSIDNYSMYLYLNLDLTNDPEDKSRTFFYNIKSLPPAHCFKYKRGGRIEPYKYWNICINKQNLNISFEESCKKFRELFYKSVMYRLRSDVSVGTSLSGGLDSSSVVLVVNDIVEKENVQNSYSARFDDPVLDEGYFMRLVAEKSRINHHETCPTIESMLDQIKDIMYYQEEPFGSASIYAQWEVFKLAKQHNTVVLLDGQGADEVLGGYTHFFNAYFKEVYKKTGKDGLDKAICEYRNNNIVNDTINTGTLFKMESSFPKVFHELRTLKRKLIGVTKNVDISDGLYSAYRHKQAPFPYFSSLNEALYYYTFNYGLEKLLRFADRNSMAHSREVRLPFLSHDIVEFAFSMPADYKIHNGWTKSLIRYGLKDILPSEIAWRKNKLGFQPPQSQWEKNDKFGHMMRDYCDIAVKERYVSSNHVSWNGFIAGLFIEQNRQ